MPKPVSVSLTGQDLIKINNRILNDLANGDCVAITFPNNLAEVVTGKNGNAIYAFNETGRQSEAVVRVLVGSADDKFLNNLLALQQQDFSAFVLLTGEFTKRVGDGKGNVQNVVYAMSGGIISKQVETTNSTEGNADQSVAVYNFKFANAPRSIT